MEKYFHFYVFIFWSIIFLSAGNLMAKEDYNPFPESDYPEDTATEKELAIKQKLGAESRVYTFDDSRFNILRAGNELFLVVNSNSEFYVYVSNGSISVIKPNNEGIEIINSLFLNGEVRVPETSTELLDLARLVNKLYLPSTGGVGDEEILVLLKARAEEWSIDNSIGFSKFEDEFFLPVFKFVADGSWQLDFLYYETSGALNRWIVIGRIGQSGVLQIEQINVEKVFKKGSFSLPGWGPN